MTEDIKKGYVSQEFILEIIMVFHTRSELDKAGDDTTHLDKLPRWTVLEGKKGFYVEEGIEIVQRLLAKRFRDPIRAYVKDEVAVDLLSKQNCPDASFDC
jgi:hypothetical protein